jgi:hypothetical protein
MLMRIAEVERVTWTGETLFPGRQGASGGGDAVGKAELYV